MNTSPQQLQKVLDTANALVRDVISETDRITNTPTQEWTVYSRQRAMEALSARSANASAAFSQWIEESVWIKNMGKICGGLDAIRMQAHYCQLAKSRSSGRAYLKQDLQRLIETFGNGCEYEDHVTTDVTSISDSERGQQVQQNGRRGRVDPEEQPYKLRELAILHGVSYMTVSRLYENEPGVLILQASPEHQRKIGRRYRTIRVPRNVYLRVRRRLENR